MTKRYFPILSVEMLRNAELKGYPIECNAWENMDPKLGGSRKLNTDNYETEGKSSGWIPDKETEDSSYGAGWNASEGRFNMALRYVVGEKSEPQPKYLNHWNITEESVLSIRDRAVAAANIVYEGHELMPRSLAEAAISWGYPAHNPGDRRWKLFTTMFEDRLCYLLGYPTDFVGIQVNDSGYVLR